LGRVDLIDQELLKFQGFVNRKKLLKQIKIQQNNMCQQFLQEKNYPKTEKTNLI
jgi:hypothetical protein